MRVHIDGQLETEVSHCLPHRWNGFEIPVFTLAQVESVIERAKALGWESEDLDIWDGVECLEYGTDEYIMIGWTWQTA